MVRSKLVKKMEVGVAEEDGPGGDGGDRILWVLSSSGDQVEEGVSNGISDLPGEGVYVCMCWMKAHCKSTSHSTQ